MIAWQDIYKNPPPFGRDVVITDWKTFCIGRRVKIRNSVQWNYRTVLLHDAVAWCPLEDFKASVMPAGEI